ncbi:MAG: hypothetical protein ACYCOX_18285, partial [Acidobacteriaceae bacterium]
MRLRICPIRNSSPLATRVSQEVSASAGQRCAAHWRQHQRVRVLDAASVGQRCAAVRRAGGVAKGRKPPAIAHTTPQSIRNLRQFLDSVDWRAIYGLNLGKGTPKQAAEKAAFVSDTLGDRLVSFQIGNEADLYSDNGLRSASYNYA